MMFLAQAYRVRSLAYFDKKKPSCNPLASWWVVVLDVGPIMDQIELSFAMIQGKAVFNEQAASGPQKDPQSVFVFRGDCNSIAQHKQC